jgi:adenosylhomocysteine nucleosidase
MTPTKIVILTAVQMEFNAVERALAGVDRQSVELRLIGIGGVRIQTQPTFDPDATIIMAGLAGALDPSLKVGDVVIDDPHGLVPASIDGCRRGAIHGADRIIATPAEKSALFERTGALAVDMESTIVKKSAASIINVRAISDTADEVLDPRVVQLVDDAGRAKPGVIARMVIRRPSLVPYLSRLGKNSKIACNALGDAVRRTVDALR